MFQKNPTLELLQDLKESQNCTHDAVRDLEETVETKIGKLEAKIDRLAETMNELLTKIKTETNATIQTNEAILALSEESRELREYIARPHKPMEREEWIPVLSKKMDKIFQKLQNHREKPVYSYLVEQRASSLVAMDPKRIAELPTAQLRSLDANLDNVLEAMEYCE